MLNKTSALKSDLSTLDLPIAVMYKLFSINSASKVWEVEEHLTSPLIKTQKKHPQFNQKQVPVVEVRVGIATGARESETPRW